MSDKVKLIVTLSKGQYENLKNLQCGSIGSRMIVNAVMNGIPLDENKGDLISKADMERILYSTNNVVRIGELFTGLPTYSFPNSAENNKGEWIVKENDSAVCSKCNRNNKFYGRYCKFCGADNGE